MTGKTDIVVVGAGAFGGWTALSLLRAGARVTLVDVREPGNALSSSGGESRVIRHAYAQRRYAEMAARSLTLWRRAEQDWGERLLHEIGVLFMSRGGPFLDQAERHMAALGIEHEMLDAAGVQRRFPAISTHAVESAMFEPGAGYLDAARACRVVRDAFVREGGLWVRARAVPGEIRGGEMHGLSLEPGGRIDAPQLVFACGPWLATLFPRLPLRITRQEVYFFRLPTGSVGEAHAALPVWADVAESLWYGIPAPRGRFKIGDDARGPEVDPETQSRQPGAAGIEAARAFLQERFPGIADAACVDARVCQYSLTPDCDFIIDRHPLAQNAWLVGGGSGHGFKHGPAVGELVAGWVLGRASPSPEYSLDRFEGEPQDWL